MIGLNIMGQMKEKNINMKISYAITVCNEFIEIQRLVNFLVKNKRSEDEIVILFDSNNKGNDVEEFLRAKSINGEFNWVPYNLMVILLT